jgi:hypothetical protein
MKIIIGMFSFGTKRVSNKGDVDVETKKDQYQPYLQIHSLTKGAAIVRYF